MELDSVTKLSQIIFYAGGLLIGMLTYRRAKSTILNTVNTEYHKKVIERLADLSEALYREFDQSSDEVWYKQDDVGHVVERLHEEIADQKEIILASGELDAGIPVSPKQMQFLNLTNKYKSDPFLPDPIRNKVVGLLEKRSNAMFNAYMTVMKQYISELAQGRHWETLNTNKHWLHNQIVDRLRMDGVGVADVEDAVHDIRLEIQRYFKQFSPVI
ncbi:MAG: hypothetical protein K9L79_18190 [Methylobacter tundripaludum]|nr:hypothetical protein [Methylobacter tundripaludum]